MKKLHFTDPFRHKHPPIQDANKLFDAQLTRGQRAADWLAAMMGSWLFIVTQSIILAAWTLLNVVAWISHWDPYPFILMNLVLSMQAAYAAPVIMMSQNRQVARDRLEAHNDYLVNKKAEEEIRAILAQSSEQNDALATIYGKLANMEDNLASILLQPPEPPKPTRLRNEK
jgi:uncharacterized membrane protein